ncbi:MAG: hypothetical protein HC853_03000 [Anaerolineae bacterium]|nr:hypothetical protein [Anaerolineae bacterium]
MTMPHKRILIALMLLLAACSPAAPQVITDPNGLPNQFEQLPTPLPTREVTPRTSVVADGVLALAGPPIGLNLR